MKAAIYSRKSKFTGKGDSIENQIQLCMDYSKSIGIKEFLVYEDEGFSGGNIDTKKLKKEYPEIAAECMKTTTSRVFRL